MTVKITHSTENDFESPWNISDGISFSALARDIYLKINNISI